MLLPLTDTQNKIFDEVCRYIRDFNYPPNIPELQDTLKISNPGTVHKNFCALEKKGYIIRVKGMHRGFRLTEEAERKYLQ